MPVGAARGLRLSGARVPHGGRTLAAVAVRRHGSSLSPPPPIAPGADWVDRAPCPVAVEVRVEVESEDSEVGSTEPPAGW